MNQQSGGGTGTGVFVGFVTAAFVIPALLFAGPVGWALLGVAAVGAFALMTRDDPFQRGLGAGLLGAGALAATFVGVCFSFLAGI